MTINYTNSIKAKVWLTESKNDGIVRIFIEVNDKDKYLLPFKIKDGEIDFFDRISNIDLDYNLVANDISDKLRKINGHGLVTKNYYFIEVLIKLNDAIKEAYKDNCSIDIIWTE